ncbi:pilus assembly protein [Novosphingobium flavum]|uniref:Pilus assembly protein n=1 Tax=Novosphingobium flavum TaxID=1778672 RepID=A0A7X1FNN9_9SPHN|nr:TadE family protein [Novosphingobium flavum]MBC2664113.1 pilus assembly protein [Novosphingobium flavum]
MWRDQCGSSVIEMSFILPVLVMLACVAADLGMAFLQQIKIQQAAARTMEMALAYKSSTTSLSTTIIHDEAATAYGYPTTNNTNVVADMWLECGGTRQSTYSGTCATGSPARYASITITDTYTWLFGTIFTSRLRVGNPNASAVTSVALKGFAEVRVQ